MHHFKMHLPKCDKPIYITQSKNGYVCDCKNMNKMVLNNGIIGFKEVFIYIFMMILISNGIFLK